MARINAAWYNFAERGQTWWHFWQDTASSGPPPTFQAAVAISQAVILPTGTGVRVA